MCPKLLTLEEWAAEVYGSRAPALVTLRRWAREARIYPPPEKHGRAYFVQADARYLDPSRPVARQMDDGLVRRLAPGLLVERIRHGKTAKH